ncbi:MAG: hypothetical protein Q7K39_04605 [Candidatus Magasanikbacteria bacterium]|nr:hypothetical protein [Candidatus Magasanikbacteria bacterium]
MSIRPRDRIFSESRLSSLVEQIVARLEESGSPENSLAELTPQVLRKTYSSVYARIIAILPTKPVGERQERDWGIFYQALAAKHPAWAKRWVTPERQRERAISAQTAKVVALLRQRQWSQQPLSPSVLREIFGNYQHLSRLLPATGAKGRERDWSPVVAQLEEFAPLWVNRQRRQEQSLAVVVGELATWLTGRPPEDITPRLLQTKNQKLYNKVSNLAHAADTGWDIIINHPLFPKEWRGWWHSKRSGHFIPADIVAAREALARERPAEFGPVWLEEHLGRAAYDRVLRRLPDVSGVSDWRAWLEALDEGQPDDQRWRGHWQTHRLGQGAQRDVERLLTEHRDSLYTMVVTETDDDSARRDATIQAFINLAQLGNNEAVRTLRRLLNELIRGWLNKDKALLCYQESPEDLDQVFEHSVATFSQTRDGSFVNYLKRQLRLISQVGHGRTGSLL